LLEFGLALPVLLLFLAGGLDLARAFFVGVETSDEAREATLFISRTAQPFGYDSLSTYDSYLPAPSGSCSGSDCTSAPAAAVAEQAFASSGMLSCPIGSTSFTFTPYSNTQAPLSQTFPVSSGGDEAGAGYAKDSFTVTARVTCNLPLLTPLLSSPVTIGATSTAYVVEP
jgi:hypothetical protein